MLPVQDVLALDPRRRLHLVRCDERRVLLLTGGAQDVVVGWLDREPSRRHDRRRASARPLPAACCCRRSRTRSRSTSISAPPGQAGATGRLVQITALVTVLSLAPSLLVMVTAFTRIVIVLSLLRSALATQGTPPNMVLIGLALFLTFFVMQPVLDRPGPRGCCR